MDPVVHFEIPAEDRNRMSDFYSSVFGWKTKMLGPEMGNYVTAATGEIDGRGWPVQPGVINGGFYMKRKDVPNESPSIVISVDNIQESIKKITEAGGKVFAGPHEIPGVGLYASFYDIEGNRASILQPMM